MIRQGWDEIGARSLDHMRRFPKPVPEFAEAPLSNLRLRVVGTAAWASYECAYPDLPDMRGYGPNGSLHNLRILEQHDGRWLIVAAALHDADLGGEVAVRTRSDGLILWQSAAAAHRLRDDEHFVQRFGRLHGRDRKLDARLREAIAWATETDKGLMPRGGSLPLFLDAQSGLPRIVWIVPDLGGALVFLDDNRPLGAMVERAARAFALSPAQQQLALAIVEGVDLKRYARTAGISMNTVRTHLKRMFEKVGASNQSGLVRTLLTLSPPR